MKYIEDGFTTNKNTRGYFITGKGLKRIKDAAKVAGLSWQAIAARPESARELVERIEQKNADRAFMVNRFLPS